MSKRSPLLLAICLLAAAPLCHADTASPTRHALLMMTAQSKDFVIGKRVTTDSGLYLSEDRQSAVHVGYHHPGVFKADFDPRDTDVLYVAALNGVLGTRDGGKSWRILMSWDMTESKDVKVDPFQPDHVYAALPNGIGVSYDRGMTWGYDDTGIQRKYTQTLVFDRSNPGTLLAGTEKGIFRKTAASPIWDCVLPTSATVTYIVQSPHDASLFLAATQADGAWLSNDGGDTWEQIHPPREGASFIQARFDPHQPDTLSISGWNVGVLISKDAGQSWTKAQGLPGDWVWSHTHDPDFPARLYANLYKDTVYVSDDDGRSWKPFLFPGAQIVDYLFIPRAH
jgi:photosystem II stability/assembly factor-like uncharacterized protein